MSISEFDCSLDASETGESTKWVNITPTYGHFVLSPVSLASRNQDGGVISHGRIGDCEQTTPQFKGPIGRIPWVTKF